MYDDEVSNVVDAINALQKKIRAQLDALEQSMNALARRLRTLQSK